MSDNNIDMGLRKNAIYLTAGYVGPYMVSGNYERMIWGNKHPVLRSVMVRAGVGKLGGEAVTGLFSTTKIEYISYFLTFGLLVGERSSFFEMGLGAVYFNGTETKSTYSNKSRTYDYEEFNPAGYLGYRYQKPGSHFVFRAGAGWPDLLYISLGFCF